MGVFNFFQTNNDAFSVKNKRKDIKDPKIDPTIVKALPARYKEIASPTQLTPQWLYPAPHIFAGPPVNPYIQTPNVGYLNNPYAYPNPIAPKLLNYGSYLFHPKYIPTKPTNRNSYTLVSTLPPVAGHTTPHYLTSNNNIVNIKSES